ncbi:MAG: T9SS type A sorting domain-containing protein [Bacteroidota bacterium]
MTKIRLFKTALFSAALLFSTLSYAQTDLVISGVFDATLSGGTPKGVELYVINDIPDLSIYGLGSANNGGGTDGEEFEFPADAATAGDFIYVASDSAQFNVWFGFDADYRNVGALAINGDDAVELFQNDVVVDVFGEIDVDGSGQPWEYQDSWAYRINGTSANTTFTLADWTIPGANTLDGESDNATAAQPIPIGTYDPSGGSTVTVYTIAEIQETTDPSGASPVVTETVETTGIVTAVGNGGYWIQDGTGAWSGIFVLDGSAAVSRGDNVTVQGAVQEAFGDLTQIAATSTTVSSSGNPVPAATAVTTGGAGVEEFESVLISVSGAICVNDDAGFGEYTLNDGSGDYNADDVLFAFSPTQFAEYDATGIAFFSFGNFKLAPRDADDIEDTGNSQLVVGFENATGDVTEDAGMVSFNVNIVNPSIFATSVDVVVTGGDAVSGVDFTFTDPTTLNFPGSSSMSQSFSVMIIDNMMANEDKTITFGLANATNGALLLPDAFTVTILDNEIVITDIAVAAATDVDGVAINSGTEYNIQGTVLGVNLSGTGLQFTIVDATGGIGLFSGSVVSGYTVNEGDEVIITGTVNQFNGLTQISPSSIVLVSTGNPIPAPTTVTALGENTESQLVKLECVTIIDPSEWDNSGSGFNVDVTNGTDTFAIRIDNEVDLYTQPAPTGEFDVVGIGGQFDFSNPFTSGYQLLPRSSADIQASSCSFVCENPFPAVDDASLSSTLLSNAVLTEWDAVPNQIGCQIQLRLAGGSILGAAIAGGANANSFVIPGGVLSLGTDYEWRVRCGCSQTPLVAGPFSAWAPFSTPGGSSITSLPNPTTGQSFVTFNVVQPEMTTLEVFDISGKMVEAIYSGIAQPNADSRFEFNGSDLPNGIYIYRLTTESEVKTEKFMIAR